MIGLPINNNDQIRNNLLNPELSESDKAVLSLLGNEYSIRPKNRKKCLYKNNNPTMRTSYESFFIRDGGVWGKIGIEEDPIIAPEKIKKSQESVAA